MIPTRKVPPMSTLDPWTLTPEQTAERDYLASHDDDRQVLDLAEVDRLCGIADEWVAALQPLTDAVAAWEKVAPDTAAIVRHQATAAAWNAHYWTLRAHGYPSHVASRAADLRYPMPDLGTECPLCFSDLRSDDEAGR